jgi:hypothetical protein
MLKETKDIKVKTEKQATRCEICHKADMFDAANNCCLRCGDIEKALDAKLKVTTSLWSPRFALLNDNSSSDASNKPFLNLAIMLLVVDVILCTTAMIFSSVSGLIICCLIGIAIMASVFKKCKFDDIVASLSTLNENAKYGSRSQQITSLFNNSQENNSTEITTLFGSDKKKNKL